MSVMNYGYISLKSVHIYAAAVDSLTTSTPTQQDKGFDPTGWELALVSTSSNNANSLAIDNNLVAFFTRTLKYLLKYLSFACLLLSHNSEFEIAMLLFFSLRMGVLPLISVTGQGITWDHVPACRVVDLTS
jgi:hypothetical protein